MIWRQPPETPGILETAQAAVILAPFGNAVEEDVQDLVRFFGNPVGEAVLVRYRECPRPHLRQDLPSQLGHDPGPEKDKDDVSSREVCREQVLPEDPRMILQSRAPDCEPCP